MARPDGTADKLQRLEDSGASGKNRDHLIDAWTVRKSEMAKRECEAGKGAEVDYEFAELAGGLIQLGGPCH